MRIGLISDTHGLLRPDALAVLRGCAHILHAGDIGKPEILDALRELAPLTVVRGTNDEGLDWAAELPAQHCFLDDETHQRGRATGEDALPHHTSLQALLDYVVFQQRALHLEDSSCVVLRLQ